MKILRSMSVLAGTVTLLVLGSCLTPKSNPLEPVYPGMNIMVFTNVMNDMAADPALVALRLNVFLNEMEFGTELFAENMESTESKAKKNTLFGSAEVEFDESQLIFTVTYPNKWYGSGKRDPYYRCGTVKIDTGGQLLNEEGALWVLSIPEDETFRISEANYFDENSNYDIIYQSWDEYAISSDGAEIAVSCKYTGKSYKKRSFTDNADWKMNWSYDMQSVEAYTIEGTANVLYKTLEMYASGTDVNGYDLVYEALEPLEYRTKCNSNKPVNGKVYSEFKNALQFFPEEDYPSSSVLYAITDTGLCAPKVEMTYNNNIVMISEHYY